MTVRIGCSSAFWGDSASAASQLVRHGNIQYLVADYLAEVTMGILAKQRQRAAKKGNNEAGFINEFVTFVWKPLMRHIREKGIKVITNAGGLNPIALKKAIEKAAEEAGEPIPIVAAVFGDDLIPNKDQLVKENQFQPFAHIDGSQDWEALPTDKRIDSLNVYLGCLPVAAALDRGAQIIVTGRVVDSAIVLGALMHEFKWKPTDYDLLAAGSLAGHIIECGCQATGGNFTDWELAAKSSHGGYANMGYPIVECSPDGSFVVTKPDKTGGLVSVATITEQMVYEIGDPASYILPDVIVDLRDTTIEEIGMDRVLVKGVKGRPPTPHLKVSGVYSDGFKVTGEIFIGGLEAAQKAKAVGDAIIARAQNLIKKFGMEDYKATNVEALGAEWTYGPHSKAANAREVVLRLTAAHEDVRALQVFLMEIAPSATCMAPGIIGVTSGRPRPQGNMVHFACLVQKTAVVQKVVVGSNATALSISFPPNRMIEPAPPSTVILHAPSYSGKLMSVPLYQICLARSGDKGDSANIGVICRNKLFYPWIRQQLIEQVVTNYMRHLIKSPGIVKRYELPGSHSFNFLLTHALGGGGLSSLQVDRQGKSYGQMLLSLEIDVPSEWQGLLKRPYARSSL